MSPRFTDIVAALPEGAPFVGPDALMRQSGRVFRARLGANESGFGPSPRAIAEIQAAADEAWMYGDAECFDLRAALAAHHGVAPEAVVVGVGIDGLLRDLAQLLVSPGDAVVTADGAYPTFDYHVAARGGAIHRIAYRDEHQDPAALLAKAEAVSAKLAYICNPDNPLGSWHSARVIARMIAAVPEGTLLVLDEAYVDSAPQGTEPPLDTDNPRVIRLRTFSKLYGLAGMRVGYAIGAPHVIAMFDRIRDHFAVGRLAQRAAIAALGDQPWLAEVCTRVAAARDRLREIAAGQGLHALPSAGNFVSLDTGRDGDFARALVAELQARDVFVRMRNVAPLDRFIRVSAAPEAELDLFEAALADSLRALG